MAPRSTDRVNREPIQRTDRRMPPVRREPTRFKDLEDAIDDVVESYSSGLSIDNLESAALPNKRAVIEAFLHIKPLVFMGFYSTRALNKENLRHAVAEHAYSAHALLVDQIER